MKRNEERADSRLAHDLDLLHAAPGRDARAAAAGRAKFMKQVEASPAARPARSFHTAFRLQAASPAFKALAAVLLVLVLVFAGTATTVYAAQDSLPGQALYPLKTLSEDSLLSLAPTPAQRLSLTLDFADRRLAEISSLQSAGLPIPESLANRFQGELDQALQLAAGMNDPAMARSLDQLSRRTQGQLHAMDQLLDSRPGDPLLANAYARLQQQASAAELGKADPQGFRLKVNQLYPVKTAAPGNGTKAPPGLQLTPAPHGSGNGHGGSSGQGTPDQGQGGKDNHKATKTPGNHGHDPDAGGGSGH